MASLPGELRLPAQVLARPGWAGSGVVSDPWWRLAVFYRLDPARFQDSGSTGQGDLAGVVQRLDYLRSLGVDALVLDDEPEAEALERLVRAASQQNLRVLLTVSPALQTGDRQALLARVREWLSAGVAGLYVPNPGSGSQSGAGDHTTSVDALQRLLQGFPGGRVLLTDGGMLQPVSPLPQRPRRSAPAPFGTAASGRLDSQGVLQIEPSEAAPLRQSLTAAAGMPGTATLVRFAHEPHTDAPNAAAEAACLLLSRGAALFTFGDEIGLDTATPVSSNHGTALPVMQWTPANVQQPAPAPIERAAPQTSEPVYGPYRPYVHPPPAAVVGAPPPPVPVAVNGDIPATLPALDTLPGFTTGVLPTPPLEGARLNVASETRDPHSLLNAYRQLIALHNGNPTLRTGAQTVLDRDAQNTVAWVRRAPASARTAADVIVAANLGDQPVTLSLDSDLRRLGVRTGALRSLFTYARQPLTGENTGSLMLPPHAVYVGEVAGARR